jgi:hypothetical protein
MAAEAIEIAACSRRGDKPPTKRDLALSVGHYFPGRERPAERRR